MKGNVIVKKKITKVTCEAHNRLVET
jgi:hypothetical protein